jgi:DNA processing protein
VSGASVLVGQLGTDVSFAADEERVHRELGAALDRWRPRLDGLDPTGVCAAAGAVGAWAVVPEDDGWPRGLDDLGPHRPMVLWCRSDRRTTDDGDGGDGGPALAVVGCRANTVAGAEATAEIASAAADAGLVIVSGGAYGVDAVAHRVAIAAGTPTTAVLAGGVDQLYPAGHHDLLRNVSRRGQLLAESPPGTRPTRWRFLARNRLIAALSGATVVVEAAARSGALNTAHHAAQLGRPVFAVPGAFASAASVGCHRLIAEGAAQIVVTPQDPVAAVSQPVHGGRANSGAPAARTALDTASDPHVQRAVDALDRRPRPVGEVARRSGLAVDDTVDALALAQLVGAAVLDADGWRRS